MPHYFRSYIFSLSLGFLTSTLAFPLAAEVLSNTNPTISNNVCVGGSCLSDESFSGSFNQLMVKATNTRILFDDATTIANFPSDDWALQANERLSGGLNQFMLTNETLGTIPVTIQAGAGSNALFLATGGYLGLGTSMPQADLHVVSDNDPSIMLQQAGGVGGPQRWEMMGNQLGFLIRDVDEATSPIFVAASAPTSSFYINSAGHVGIGTSTPDAPLTVSSPDAFTFFRIEALGASPNTAADMTFTSGPAGSGGEFRINVVDGDGPEMRVDGAGFVTAFAGFKVGGTTLAVPDYVFEPDYALRPLSEVATFIESNKHLPDVPSSSQVAQEGLDMTQMQLTLLKKIEELTLYTLEQQAVIDKHARMNKAQSRENAVLAARVDRLEALLVQD